jgi:hypothetical protein
MYAIVAWILEVMEIKELIVALDATHAFKSQNNKSFIDFLGCESGNLWL